jgi:hypothetical protein
LTGNALFLAGLGVATCSILLYSSLRLGDVFTEKEKVKKG